MAQLQQLLGTAFLQLQQVYSVLDRDRVGKVTIQELMRYLFNRGFRNDQALTNIFQRVDKDNSGTLDFPEFCTLVYLWREVGQYQTLFSGMHPSVAGAVQQAFDIMEKAYTSYDQDNSRQLSHQEFGQFMAQNFGAGYQQAIVDQIFPANMPVLSFSRFLRVMWAVTVPQDQQIKFGAAPAQGNLSRLLLQMFDLIEQDFKKFDRDGSNTIDLKELTEGVSMSRPSNERLDVLTRMEHWFRQVDVDRSETIDFFEFLYLAFLISKGGSYRDLVDQASDATLVKHALLALREAYVKYDADHSNRLSLDEVVAFFNTELGGAPANTQQVFVQLQSSPDRPHIDFVRFFRLMYTLLKPSGHFLNAKPQKPSAPPARPVISTTAAGKSNRPPRIDNINVAAIKKGKLLGQGGQGVVYMAEYNGITCAAKFLLQNATPELCQETAEEAKLMWSMDHENVHYLLGCRTTMPDICMLTEACNNGSLFDMYCKKRLRFDRPTLLRFAIECARGMAFMHKMNYMHRDLKSLNVFVDAQYVCKVADFGMAKNPRDGQRNQRGMGTPQWMAPEVIVSENYNEACDLFSFGVLLFEIAHLEVPYMETGMNQMQISQAVVHQQIRPQIRSHCPPQFRHLVEACWQQDPSRRPNMGQVLATLESPGMAQEFNAAPLPWGRH